MREEAQSQQTICVFCGKPISQKQRPAVAIRPGKEAHMGCWVQHENDT